MPEQCNLQPGAILHPQTYKPVYDALEAGADSTQKSKYETQAQYEERIRKSGVRTYAIAGKAFTDEELAYDAETETFQISDESLRRLTRYTDKLHYDVHVELEHEVVGKARMRNGWGDEWTEDVLEGYSYKIDDGWAPDSDRGGGVPRNSKYTFFQMDTGKDYHEERIIVPMPRNVAMANDSKIRAAFIITPMMVDGGKYTRFVSNPETKYYTIYATVHCAVFLDKNDRVIRFVPTVNRETARTIKDVIEAPRPTDPRVDDLMRQLHELAEKNKNQ